jgi:hypothetical protein
MMLSSSAVDRVYGYRLEPAANLIAVGLLESGRPRMRRQDLTTAKTVAKISGQQHGGREECGTPIHRS